MRMLNKKDPEDLKREQKIQKFRKNMSFLKYQVFIVALISGALLTMSLSLMFQEPLLAMAILFMCICLCFGSAYITRDVFELQRHLGAFEGLMESKGMMMDCMEEVLADMPPKDWKELQRALYEEKVSSGMKLLGRGRE